METCIISAFSVLIQSTSHIHWQEFPYIPEEATQEWLVYSLGRDEVSKTIHSWVFLVDCKLLKAPSSVL